MKSPKKPVKNKSPLRAPVQLNRQTMAGQVAEELRRRILAGEHVEGEQLMQEQLASEFGVSKVPVREALHMLEAEGLVVQQFHRGAVVSGLEPAHLMELFELRTQIEVWLLGLAMPVATETDVDEARRMNARLSASDEPVQGWDLNWRFHEMMYRPANKPYVLEHLKTLHSRTARYVRLQYSIATNKQKILDQHENILAAYARKDATAMDLLRSHILGAAKKLTDRLAEIKAARNID